MRNPASRLAGFLVVVIAAAAVPAMAGGPIGPIGPGPSMPGLTGIASRPVPAPPPNIPYPTIPWSPMSGSTQTVTRYIWSPGRSVVLDISVPWQREAPPATAAQAAVDGPTETPAPEAVPSAEPQFGTLRQTYTVPGFWIAETAAGLHYPARWALEQTASGVYQWRLLAPTFQSR